MADPTNTHVQGSRSSVLESAASLIELSAEANPEALRASMMVALGALHPDDIKIIAQRNVQTLKELSLKHKNTSQG